MALPSALLLILELCRVYKISQNVSRIPENVLQETSFISTTQVMLKSPPFRDWDSYTNTESKLRIFRVVLYHISGKHFQIFPN